MSARPVVMLTVVYARDIGRVASFYARTLALPVLEEQPGYVVLGNDALEIAVVRIREAATGGDPVAAAPRRREETPIKPSFLVGDFARVHAEAIAAGGGMKPVSSAWSWRGQLHLDGHDPEGNIVQFRCRES